MRKTFVGTVRKISPTSRLALKSPTGSNPLRDCCHTKNRAYPGRYSHRTTALPTKFLMLNVGSPNWNEGDGPAPSGSTVYVPVLDRVIVPRSDPYCANSNFRGVRNSLKP